MTNKKYTPKVVEEIAKLKVETTEGNGRFGKNVDQSKVAAPSTSPAAPSFLPPPASPHPAIPSTFGYVLPNSLSANGGSVPEGVEENQAALAAERLGYSEEEYLSPYYREEKGIKTFYKGIWFRSQTEAFWAIFWDRVGIQWKFERSAVRMANGNYRVDFYLPAFALFVEIKGPFPAGFRAQDKCKFLRQASGKDVLLVWGYPCWWLDDSYKKGSIWSVSQEEAVVEGEKNSGGSFLFQKEGKQTDFVFAVCGGCNTPWLRPLGKAAHICGRGEALTEKEFTHPTIILANRVVETFEDWDPENEVIRKRRSKKKA